MKTKIYVISILLLCNIASFAQAPDWLWAKNAGSVEEYEMVSIANDDSGNIYIAGRFFSTTITFGSITLTNAGVYGDMYLVKYDANGNVIWALREGGTNDDGANSIAVDGSGNIFVAGYFESPTIAFGSTTLTNMGSRDMFLAKYDTNGNILWAKSAGSTGYEDATSLALDTLGNISITGEFGSTIIFGSTTLSCPNGNAIFVAKYDNNGNVLWAKSTCSSTSYYDVTNSITTDNSGNIYVVGWFDSPNITFGSITLTNTFGGRTIWFVKYDANGNVLWAKSAEGRAKASCVVVDDLGKIYIVGHFESSTLTIGSTILTNNSNLNYGDLFLAKYDNNGNVLWAKSAGGTVNDGASSIEVDAFGNSYVTGWFKSSPFTLGSNTLINAGGEDIFLAKFDINGNVLWAKGAGSEGTDWASSITIDATGNTYVAGTFIDYPITFGSIILTPTTNYWGELFVAKLGSGAGINELSDESNISVFPNPATNKITIITPEKSTIEISNIKGQIIKTFFHNNGETSIDIGDLYNGVYIVRLKTDKEIVTKKIIKQ